MLRRCFLYDAECSYIFRTGHDGASVFYYARFFSCYFFYGISQPVHVVHRDGCYYSHQRRFADIGRVSASSQSHFKYDIVAVFFFEIEKGYGCNDFKFRGRLLSCICHGFGSLQNSVSIQGQVFVANIFSVQFYSFVEYFYER